MEAKDAEKYIDDLGVWVGTRVLVNQAQGQSLCRGGTSIPLSGGRMNLEGTGYVTTRRTQLAAEALLQGAHLLLEGAPGTGKTLLGEKIAEAMGWPCIYGQLHAWSDADELFVGVDVAAAVAGDAAAVRQPGLLARAAEQSSTGPVVLVLDEIDKTSERCEALLLDFLQTGRVPLRPGQHVQARLDHLHVVVTSNATRPLSDALLRRLRRVRIEALPAKLVHTLVAQLSDAPLHIATLVARACLGIAQAEAVSLSPQEMARATRECLDLATSADDVREILAAWAVRSADGLPALKKAPVGAIWGEIKALTSCGIPSKVQFSSTLGIVARRGPIEAESKSTKQLARPPRDDRGGPLFTGEA